MSRHRTLTGKNIHGPYRRLFADAAERLADSEVYIAAESIAGGSGNPAIALQVDNLTEWVLQDHDPTAWVAQTVTVGPHLMGGTQHLPSEIADVNTKISDADIFPRVANEPTGFVNRTDSVISRVDGTRTFTIQPAGPPASYDIWIAGRRYTKSAPESVVWPDTEGLHAFYFDTSGVLQTTQAISNDLILTYVLVGYVYWNAVDKVSIRFLEERHGLEMDGPTHLRWHKVTGAAWVSGLALANIISEGSGNDNAHAQFAVDDGAIIDEDIEHLIVDDSPQDLSPIAQIPIYYRLGVDVWRKKTADDFPMIYQGTVGYPVGQLVPYNLLSGGVWSLEPVPNNDFVCIHFYATNDVEEPFIGVQGQTYYLTVVGAREGAATEIRSLKLDGLPIPEITPIATVIVQTSNGYSNTPQARIREVDAGQDYIDYRGEEISGGGVAATEAVFGKDYQRVDSEGEDSTTSATPQDKVTLVTSGLIGTYRIGWSAQVNNGDKKSAMRLYNETDAAVVGQVQPYRVKDDADRYPRYTASKEVVFTGTAKTFKLQYYSLDGQTAYIRGAYIEFWRVK